ncbi:AAA domain-containing protein [Gracilibacillus orientalis]|uniref:AAA domain-containing protein n=1 Tax=Gracilibacillus orientalis TaxID=334253 RepID=A0A1I4LKJ9_9BACI|nr:AAA family ATPase [Gracilibacillus orientalis]SFL91564.1 AAA domain-containing protein [Gracilibacillus orientalis]
MKFVLIFGPQAVGKMTVGQELAKITELKLLHNHMTIDLLEPFFGFETETWRLSTLFREEIMKSFAKSENYGMIFTYVWAFNEDEDWNFVKNICHIFESENAEIYFVELEADVDQRVIRNKTPNRLEQKPTKRNIQQSEEELLNSLNAYRLNSEPREIERKNHLRINNTELSAEEVASLLKKEFKL